MKKNWVQDATKCPKLTNLFRGGKAKVAVATVRQAADDCWDNEIPRKVVWCKAALVPAYLHIHSVQW